jgi:LAGLIDADG endonuclease
MIKINNTINDLTLKLDPYFITGLTESEGCFSVFLHKDNRAKFKRSVGLRYKITMLENELELLKMVKSFFDCGVLSENKDGSVDFSIRDISSIRNKVLPHFLKYPLRGTKYLDFLSFKEAFYIIDKKEHLIEEGLLKLDMISKSMNNYRQFSLVNYYFPSHTVLDNVDFIPLNGHYINGFIAGDGCLALNLSNKNFCRMSLQITQHINNKLLLYSIANYFKSPSKVYKHDKNSLQITLSGFKL